MKRFFKKLKDVFTTLYIVSCFALITFIIAIYPAYLLDEIIVFVLVMILELLVISIVTTIISIRKSKKTKISYEISAEQDFEFISLILNDKRFFIGIRLISNKNYIFHLSEVFRAIDNDENLLREIVNDIKEKFAKES